MQNSLSENSPLASHLLAQFAVRFQHYKNNKNNTNNNNNNNTLQQQPVTQYTPYTTDYSASC